MANIYNWVCIFNIIFVNIAFIGCDSINKQTDAVNKVFIYGGAS